MSLPWLFIAVLLTENRMDIFPDFLVLKVFQFCRIMFMPEKDGK